MKKRLFSIFYCQLLFAGLVHAQTAAIKEPGQFREQAYLHTDRNFYLAGDIVWLKMYCLTDITPDKLKSAIGYIDLYNIKGTQPIEQLKILLDTISNGYIQLPDSLSTGTYVMRAYTRNMEQYGFIFEKKIRVVNSFKGIPALAKISPAVMPADTALHLHTSLNSEAYGKRQAVNISFSAFQETQTPTTANLSMSVYKLNELEQINNPSIQKFTLPTESVLLTKDTAHLPEIVGQVLTGIITDKKNRQPVSVPVFLTVTGRTPKFYCNPSEPNGRFAFELKGYSNNANIILQAAAKNYQITIDNPFATYNHPAVVDPFLRASSTDSSNTTESSPLTDSTLINELRDAHIAMQAMMVYYGDSILQLDDHFTDSTVFFGKPDEEVLLDDYTRFNTVEEIFREFVKTVMVRKNNDTLHLRTLNNLMDNPKFFDDDPLVLLDGVPFLDKTRLFALDPLKIRKVSVLARTTYYAGLVIHGVVSLQTYVGDMAGYKLDPNALVVDYGGTQVPLKFFSPSYAPDETPTLPDKRNLLYWNPNINTSADGQGSVSFYTGDIPGKYCMILQGITAKGEPCYARKIFFVQ